MVFLKTLGILLVILILEEIQASTKFTYLMESMGSCTGPEYANMESPLTNLKLVKLNHTAKTLSFDVNWLNPLDHKTFASITIQKLSNGVSREITFIPPIPNPCKVFLKSYRNIWIEMMTHIGLKHPDECPIPAGKYSLRNFVFNTVSNETYAIPMQGRFIIRTIIGEITTKKIISCIQTITQHNSK